MTSHSDSRPFGLNDGITDAEFESLPGAHDSGPNWPPPGSPPRYPPPETRRPGRELVLADPPFSGVPLPPWLDIRHVPPAHDANPELPMLHTPGSVSAHQFRAMRYRIEQDPDAQIIAIVSPRAKEGRSVTAANLALALAEGRRVKVLLIDASLERPSQAARFGIEGPEGLTSVLRDRRDDPYAPVTVFAVRQGLYVLPAGPKPISAHAVLASEEAAMLLGSLRRLFRYIVVDASAVFGSAETLAWHGMIDRYIVVARRGLTRTDDLERAANRVDRNKILGVSFLGATETQCAP